MDSSKNLGSPFGTACRVQRWMDQLNQKRKYTALTVNIQPAASGQDSRDAMMIAADLGLKAK